MTHWVLMPELHLTLNNNLRNLRTVLIAPDSPDA